MSKALKKSTASATVCWGGGGGGALVEIRGYGEQGTGCRACRTKAKLVRGEGRVGLMIGKRRHSSTLTAGDRREIGR